MSGKYNVHIYHVVRTKLTGIEAGSQHEAIQKATKLFPNTQLEFVGSGPIEDGVTHEHTECADEIISYLVDEQADPEFNRSRFYDANELEDQTKDSNTGTKRNTP